MDIPQHVRARGYERHDAHGTAGPHTASEPLFGRYICLDLREKPDLPATFDAVALLVERGLQASAAVPFSKVAWSLVVLGVEPAERARVAAVQREYVSMWDRHPHLWDKVSGREGIFTVWLVDGERRPYLGCVCEECPWDVWLAERDLRESRAYKRFLAEGQPQLLMALNAVHAAELTEMYAGRAAA